MPCYNTILLNLFKAENTSYVILCTTYPPLVGGSACYKEGVFFNTSREPEAKPEASPTVCLLTFHLFPLFNELESVHF